MHHHTHRMCATVSYWGQFCAVSASQWNFVLQPAVVDSIFWCQENFMNLAVLLWVDIFTVGILWVNHFMVVVVAVVCMALLNTWKRLFKFALQGEIDRTMRRWFALIGMCKEWRECVSIVKLYLYFHIEFVTTDSMASSQSVCWVRHQCYPVLVLRQDQ